MFRLYKNFRLYILSEKTHLNKKTQTLKATGGKKYTMKKNLSFSKLMWLYKNKTKETSRRVLPETKKGIS